MASSSNPQPEWQDRIRRLLRDLKISQAGLAGRLGVSPATVSRWVQGRFEPTAEMYVALGNLAHHPDRLYFWGRAGLNTLDDMSTGSAEAMSSLRMNVKELNVLAGAAGAKVSGRLLVKGDVVAIPLIAAVVYGDEVPPRQNVHLPEVPIEDVLLVPASWCPQADSMIGMHVSGDSMSPLILPGSIIFVNTAMTDRALLNQKLAVVSHRDLGFKVARFQRVQHADLLVSANHKYRPLDVSNASKWHLVGEVLWWISRDPDSRSSL